VWGRFATAIKIDRQDVKFNHFSCFSKDFQLKAKPQNQHHNRQSKEKSALGLPAEINFALPEMKPGPIRWRNPGRAFLTHVLLLYIGYRLKDRQAAESHYLPKNCGQ
jgi:hypothetical protein